MKTYQIQSNLDTMLLFYENSEKVVASISLNQIPVEKMVNIILQHQYLTLPRLSSQEIFEGTLLNTLIFSAFNFWFTDDEMRLLYLC